MMLKERCKKRHWWSRDPHNWKTWKTENPRARQCQQCGLMQTYHTTPATAFWRDATKQEFDKVVAETLLDNKKEDKLQKDCVTRRKQIEIDRLLNNPKENVVSNS